MKCSSDVEVKRMRRVNGTQVSEWDVIMGLCASCSDREADNRADLAAAQAPTTHVRASRKYDNE